MSKSKSHLAQCDRCTWYGILIRTMWQSIFDNSTSLFPGRPLWIQIFSHFYSFVVLEGMMDLCSCLDTLCCHKEPFSMDLVLLMSWRMLWSISEGKSVVLQRLNFLRYMMLTTTQQLDTQSKMSTEMSKCLWIKVTFSLLQGAQYLRIRFEFFFLTSDKVYCTINVRAAWARVIPKIWHFKGSKARGKQREDILGQVIVIVFKPIHGCSLPKYTLK